MLDFCSALNFLTIKLVNHNSNRNVYLTFLLSSLNLPGLRDQNHATELRVKKPWLAWDIVVMMIVICYKLTYF